MIHFFVQMYSKPNTEIQRNHICSTILPYLDFGWFTFPHDHGLFTTIMLKLKILVKLVDYLLQLWIIYQISFLYSFLKFYLYIGT
jgi:hypothetical protein